MSQPSSAPAPPVAPGRPGLRLLLFGRPGAGKTSLLASLAQAAQNQEHLLNGRLTEPNPALEVLRQQLYEESSRPTMEEVVLYPVDFESFDGDGKAGSRERFQALLIDCDGRAANDLLMRRQTLTSGSVERPLAQEVLSADTMILVVDASERASQIDADFAEFKRFLRLFEKGRGQRSEVGGMPVFLVLSKCDLLAQPTDAPVDWVERIEEKKRQVGQRFKEFLDERDEGEGPLPFGSIDLHLWATAVKRPALAGSPARPREPYGVAELFRQCLEQAHAFHQRRRHSSRRLVWTVAGAIGLVGVLLAMTAFLLSQALRENSTDTQAIRLLENKIDTYQLSEGQTTAERLRGTLPQLRQRVAVLTELKGDADFSKLFPERQAFVQNRLQELQDYVAYREKLEGMRLKPADARREAELREIEQTLTTDLAVPREAWGQTEAARLQQEYRDQVAALRKAVDDVEEWYRQKQREGEKLWTFAGRQSGTSLDWRAWQGDVEKLFEDAEKPPFRDNMRLPGPGAPTYDETVLKFQRVREAKSDWETVKQRLQKLLDLSAVLGLAPQAGRPAVLAIPAKPLPTLADMRDRLQRLKEAYPRYAEEFTLTDVPDAAMGDIRHAAAASYDHLLEAGREQVLRQLQQAGTGDQETPERWDSVQRWLQKDPEELRPLRELARVLTALKDGVAIDPVSELRDFLGKTTFPLELKRVTVEIPDRLKVRPAGSLSIYFPPVNESKPALTFELAGDMQRDPQRRVTIYTYRPTDNRGQLTYQRGKPLWATLPLKDADGRDWQFTWARSPSEVFQQHRLSRAPRLHRKDEDSAKGELADGVILRTSEGPPIPPVPDLLPVVRLEKR